MLFPSQNAPKSMSAGASQQTLLAYSAPQTPSWFQGVASRQEGNGGEGGGGED